MASKLQWGELADDDGDDNDLDFILPPRLVIGPDDKGVKKIIEYKFDDDGNKMKVATICRVKKLAVARLTKRSLERRAWQKFGDAIRDDVGITMVSTEEIVLERPTVPGTVAKESYGDSLTEAGKSGGAVLMLCRTCGKKGDHWTARCPYKDLAAPVDTCLENISGTEAVAGNGNSAYVPPIRRAGAAEKQQPFKRRSDENSVRVTNLSEDTREADLGELFGAFGAVDRVYVATDQKSGVSRGFGFISFVRREDAERAMKKLNGYGYDNLILGVEWAAPRAN